MTNVYVFECSEQTDPECCEEIRVEVQDHETKADAEQQLTKDRFGNIRCPKCARHFTFHGEVKTKAFTVPCPDQSDPYCEEVVEVELDYRLTQAAANQGARDGTLEVPSCPECGSDQMRDSEGSYVA